MPSFGPAFDKTAFDVGAFDATYSIPLLVNIIVPREVRRIKPGSSMFVTIYIQGANADGSRFSLNTATVPTIVIFKPDTYLVYTFANMYGDGDVGHYSYQYQSDPDDMLGPYTAQFTAINGDKTFISPSVRLFEMV